MRLIGWFVCQLDGRIYRRQRQISSIRVCNLSDGKCQNDIVSSLVSATCSFASALRVT